MEFSSDVNLFDQLQSGGITPDTCDILKEEQILTPDIFFSLGQEHFAALSKRVKIGQHVLLLKIWDKGMCKGSTRMSLSPSPSASSSSSLKQPEDVRQSIKDLAALYKSKNQVEVKGASKKGSDPRKITIILGGMLYNSLSGKGVKRDYLPKPNPQKVEMPKNCTFREIVHKAKTLYFGEDADESKMNLADSSGIMIQVDKASWNLDQYYKDNNYQPSRHKIYVLYDNEPDMTEYELFGSESDDDKDQEPKSKKSHTHILSDRVIKQGYTLPIMSMCIECGNKFRTYKPGKDCLLPNGNVECHQEPQLKCPDCDCGYGLHMNQDLFPHLLEFYPHHAIKDD